jgi:prepilin-type processing-associated H-X9-DG protein
MVAFLVSVVTSRILPDLLFQARHFYRIQFTLTNPVKGPDGDNSKFPPGYAANTDNGNGAPLHQPFIDCQYGNCPNSASLAQLQQPSETIGVVEFQGLYSDYRVTSNFWGFWASSNSLMFAGHTDHSNFLFLDGHVKALRPLQTLDVADGGSASTNMWTNDGSSFTSEGATTPDEKGLTDLTYAQTFPAFN